MLIDKRSEFGAAASLVGTAASVYILGDVIDLGATHRDIGRGCTLRLRISIDTLVAATGGASNVTFKLVSDSTANLATSPTVHWASDALAKGTLVAGYVVADICLPAEGPVYERYLGVTYTPDTNDTTSGKANASLVMDTPTANSQFYAEGVV